MMDANTKQQVQGRLKRIAGPVGGSLRMVDEDRCCIDVLLQLAAAPAALGKVGKILLASHVRTCVAHPLSGGDPEDQQSKVEQLLNVFDRCCNA